MNLRNAFRNAIKMSVALLLAFIANVYFSFSHEYWLALAAFCVTYESLNQPIRHALIAWVIMIAAIFCAAILQFYSLPLSLIVLLMLLLISSAIFILKHSWSIHVRAGLVLFVLMMTIAVMWLPDTATLRDRINAVCIGGLIGLVSSLLIFPFKPNIAFRQGIIPVLKKLHEYSRHLVTVEKINLENALIFSPYPEWVYETGFNPGLRGGFRFFLVHLEQIVDLYFALQSHHIHQQKQLPEEFSRALDNNSQLIAMLINYFVTNQVVQTDLDFTSDLTAMENVARDLIPANIEILDLTPEYLQISAVVYTVKDIRKQLLQLLNSLPASYPLSSRVL